MVILRISVRTSELISRTSKDSEIIGTAINYLQIYPLSELKQLLSMKPQLPIIIIVGLPPSSWIRNSHCSFHQTWRQLMELVTRECGVLYIHHVNQEVHSASHTLKKRVGSVCCSVFHSIHIHTQQSETDCSVEVAQIPRQSK